MSMLRKYFRVASLVLPLALAAAQAAHASGCQLGTREHPIEHVIYLQFDNVITDITARRDAIAAEMLDMLEGAEFSGTPVTPWRAEQLIAEAQLLLESVE